MCEKYLTLPNTLLHKSLQVTDSTREQKTPGLWGLEIRRLGVRMDQYPVRAKIVYVKMTLHKPGSLRVMNPDQQVRIEHFQRR